MVGGVVMVVGGGVTVVVGGGVVVVVGGGVVVVLAAAEEHATLPASNAITNNTTAIKLSHLFLIFLFFLQIFRNSNTKYKVLKVK